MSDPSNIWIYHERQQALLCGQHALNNLVQGPVFSVGELSEFAHQLDALELNYMAQNNEGGIRSPDYLRRLSEGSGNVDAQGNFSIQVLKTAIQKQYNITLPHLTDAALQGKDITQMQGFICHKSDHWFAIREIGGRFWNLNSMMELPVSISHFQLATEMKTWKKEGYTVFCIPSGLPAAGNKNFDQHSSCWHLMSNLVQGKATQADPWEQLKGSGLRLDGGAASASSSGSSAQQAISVEGLTEEEQLQIALHESLNPTQQQHQRSKNVRAVSADIPTVTVPPEPAPGAPNSCRIQFRLPDGKRVVRRFSTNDSVAVLYSYCRLQINDDDRRFELRAGFPPRDLASTVEQSIQEAGLAGESIQGRYL
jgi:Ataxin-3